MARSSPKRSPERRQAPATASRHARRRPTQWLFGGAAALALAGLGLWYWKSGRPSNLLLVTIDTLRADHVGAYGYREATTPVLDGLAARGTRFENVQSAAPLTGPSHATIFTGDYPPAHGVRDNARFVIEPGVTTLAERLRRAGYETAAFVGAFPVAATFGFGRGFDTFDEGLRPSAVAGGVAERPADAVATAAIRWLSARGNRRFFAWVHFFDPHEPYTPPAPYRARFANPYDGEVGFADAQLGRVLAALRLTERGDDTIVAILSDHGEGLGEHGETTHGLLLYESTLRVPFVLAGPGVPAGRALSERVGTVDVLPTLMALLGQPLPAGLPGRDLARGMSGSSLPRQPLYSESLYGRLNCRWAPLRGWTDRDWKLVEGNGTALFDLGRDPTELQDLASENPERAGVLRQALHRAVQAIAPEGDRARPRPIGASEAEALRSLGYVGGGAGAGELDEPGLPDPRERRPFFERLRTVSGAAAPQVAAAIQEVTELARDDPGNPFVHEVLAGLALRAGRLDVAAGALAAFLDIEPRRSDVRTQRGRLLQSLGRLEEAEQELRRALADGGADALARVTLADTLVARGRTQEAEPLLQEVLATDPRHHLGRLALGRLRVAQGRITEAVSFFEGAAAGGHADALLELAEAYALMGRTAASVEAAKRVLAASPTHPWAMSLVGYAFVIEGDKEAGEALLQRALRAGPRRPRVWMRLAEGFQALGQSHIARRCRAEASARGRAQARTALAGER